MLCLGISETNIALQLLPPLCSTRCSHCAPWGSVSSVTRFNPSTMMTASADTAQVPAGSSLPEGLALNVFLSLAGALAPHPHSIQHPFQLLQPLPTHPPVHPHTCYHHIPSDLRIT